LSAPNVLLLAVDSLRADAVFGAHIPTPTFDAYAARGAVFRQCICTATTTTPSFSSILTGCYPPKHGVRGLQGYSLAPQVTTAAEAFAAAGYHTYAEVTGPLLPETGVLRGFAEARHRPGYRAPFFGWRDEVIARMKEYQNPWFMLLHIWEVHRPFRSPPDFKRRWDRAGYEAAVEASDQHLAPVLEAAGDNTIIVITGDHGEEYPDTQLGVKLVSAARRFRKKAKPARWFPALDKQLQEMQVGHGFALREQLVRVPLIISGPGVPRADIADQVRHVDLFPTLADLAGVGIPPGIDGRSLRPLWDEGGSLTEEPAYMEAVGVKLEGRKILGARTPDWKLLRMPGGRNALHKLNGGAAPDEKRNLYRQYPEVAHRLELYIEEVNAASVVVESGMTSEQEAVVEQHLKDLGYL
jgi:arylsulfatase A-like enzyme